MTTREMNARDLDWVLRLNTEFERELSPLAPEKLSEMVGASFRAEVADPQAGFLITFDQGASYASTNFMWFRERYPRFVYVDRIAVSPQHRRKGIAGALYDAAFVAARALGHTMIACEVNVDPPNPQSDAFHFDRGFEVVGTQSLDGGAKTVRYMICPLL